MQEIIVVRHRSRKTEVDRGIVHLEARGFALRPVSPYAGEPLPAINGRTTGVLIEGGPQMITDTDQHPYLLDEIDFAGRAMASGVPVLGICLGAQVLARQLGAAVDYHPDGRVAFGYYEVEATEAGRDLFPPGLHAPAGNAQGFELPAGTTLLARGRLFPNQAFRIDGNIYALQFHPEVTRSILSHWQNILHYHYDKPGAQTREQQDALYERHDPPLDAWYTGFLDRIFGVPEPA